MMQPIGDKVLVKMIREEKSRGGIILPLNHRYETNWQGIVIAKGSGRNAAYVTIGARVIIEKMVKMTGAMEGLGIAAMDCDENGDLKKNDCLLVDAVQILGEIEE
jgi:co-chaperonin GroES (HSP10)